MIKKYILGAFSICINPILLSILIAGIIKIDLLNNIKLIISSISLLSLIFLTFYTYLNKNIKVYNIGIFISFLLNIILIYNVVELNTKYSYIDNIFNKDYHYITYNVYVQRKTTTYSNIYKLNGKTIGLLNNNLAIESNLKNNLDLNFKYYNNINEIEEAILKGDIQSFILTDEEYEQNKEIENNIIKKVRIIYSDKIAALYK